MADETLKRDENRVVVLGGVTDDANQEVTMLRVDPTTKRLLISATGGAGSGTVTSVSVVSANGFAGSVATATTTPAITISTTITGLLRGNGTAISAVTIGSGLSFDGTTLSATGGSSGITIGTTTITSGTNTRILYNNSGVVGEYTLTGTGTVVVMQTAPTFATSITTPSVLATANDSGAIGSATNSFSDLFLASGALINFANGNAVITHSSGILTVSTGDLRVTTAGTNTASVVTVGGTQTLTSKTFTSPVINTQISGDVTSGGNITTTNFIVGATASQTLTNKTLTAPVISSISNSGTITLPTGTRTLVARDTTDTLTNKRITKRVTTETSSATPTINTDNSDIHRITALAVAVTSFTTNLTGTPTDGQTLWISITDNGTARAITWGASFEASTVALPTTTVISTRLDVGFVWNTATSRWRCVAVA